MWLRVAGYTRVTDSDHSVRVQRSVLSVAALGMFMVISLFMFFVFVFIFADILGVFFSRFPSLSFYFSVTFYAGI